MGWRSGRKFALAVAVANFERQAGVHVKPDFGGILARVADDLEMTHAAMTLRRFELQFLARRSTAIGRDLASGRHSQRKARHIEGERRQLIEQREQVLRPGDERHALAAAVLSLCGPAPDRNARCLFGLPSRFTSNSSGRNPAASKMPRLSCDHLYRPEQRRQPGRFGLRMQAVALPSCSQRCSLWPTMRPFRTARHLVNDAPRARPAVSRTSAPAGRQAAPMAAAGSGSRFPTAVATGSGPDAAATVARDVSLRSRWRRRRKGLAGDRFLRGGGGVGTAGLDSMTAGTAIVASRCTVSGSSSKGSPQPGASSTPSAAPPKPPGPARTAAASGITPPARAALPRPVSRRHPKPRDRLPAGSGLRECRARPVDKRHAPAPARAPRVQRRVSPGNTGTAACTMIGPQSSVGVTKCTVQPCTRTPACSARFVRMQAGKGRQQGGMNIDETPCETLDKRRRSARA